MALTYSSFVSEIATITTITSGVLVNGDNNFGGLVNNGNDGRFLGGVQGGADYQFAPNWVLGVEGQYSWLGNNNNTVVFGGPGLGYAYTNNQRAIGSATGRIGYTWGPALLYVKGGYAWADTRDSLTFLGAPAAFSFDHNHKDGYTVGGGLEYMFAQNWSAKVEYQYYNFGNSAFVTPAPLATFGSFHNDEHTVKAGINYRFNWAAWAARSSRGIDLGLICAFETGKGRPCAGLFVWPRENQGNRPDFPDFVNQVTRYCSPRFNP